MYMELQVVFNSCVYCV